MLSGNGTAGGNSCSVGDSTPGRNDDDSLLFSISSSSNDFSTKASSVSIVDAPESLNPLGEGDDEASIVGKNVVGRNVVGRNVVGSKVVVGSNVVGRNVVVGDTVVGVSGGTSDVTVGGNVGVSDGASDATVTENVGFAVDV